MNRTSIAIYRVCTFLSWFLLIIWDIVSLQIRMYSPQIFTEFQINTDSFSILPINKNTLVYGSGDHGNTILCSEPQVNQKMEQAAAMLKIKGHQTKDKLLYAPFDIEVSFFLISKFDHRQHFVSGSIWNLYYFFFRSTRVKMVNIICLILPEYSLQYHQGNHLLVIPFSLLSYFLHKFIRY